MLFILCILQTQGLAAKEVNAEFNLSFTLWNSVWHTDLISRSSDRDAVRHFLGKQVDVLVRFVKGCVPCLNLFGDFLKLLPKFRNGILGLILSKQLLRILTYAFLGRKKKHSG